MKFNKEETEQFILMMEWAGKSKDIRSFSVTAQGAVIFIVSNHINGKKIEGYGHSLSKAMKNYTMVFGNAKKAMEILNVQ